MRYFVIWVACKHLCLYSATLIATSVSCACRSVIDSLGVHCCPCRLLPPKCVRMHGVCSYMMKFLQKEIAKANQTTSCIVCGVSKLFKLHAMFSLPLLQLHATTAQPLSRRAAAACLDHHLLASLLMQACTPSTTDLA